LISKVAICVLLDYDWLWAELLRVLLSSTGYWSCLQHYPLVLRRHSSASFMLSIHIATAFQLAHVLSFGVWCFLAGIQIIDRL
jgi:predicted FMN-binding regulatory protein PaiB